MELWSERVALNARSSDLDARETALVEAEDAVGSDTAKVQARSNAVGAREAAAQDMADEANTVLAAAEGLAEDYFELKENACGPCLAVTETGKASNSAKALIQRVAKSKKGRRRAEGIFGRVWSTMRTRARGEAEEKLGEEFAQIETTREALMDVVKDLPPAIRQHLGTTWKTVAKQVVSLRQLLRKRGHSALDGGRSGSTPPDATKPDEK